MISDKNILRLLYFFFCFIFFLFKHLSYTIQKSFIILKISCWSMLKANFSCVQLLLGICVKFSSQFEKYFNKFDIRVSIRKTFAQFLRKETQNFFFVAHQFCAKKQQFAQSFAKVISRKIALFRFYATQVLRNSAISL